jgi:molybdopterin molybdotransferase
MILPPPAKARPHTLSVEETWACILSHCPVRPETEVQLSDAAGYVLAEAVRADRDQPPADRSAMDGFAVRAADLVALPARLTVVAEVAAGSASAPTISAGTCARIFTGANVPAGADTVVMVEDTRDSGDDTVEIVEAVRPHANIFKRGENAKQGDALVAPGCLLTSMPISVCATAGRTHVRIRPKPRVAIVTTGQELREPGSATAAYEERDSNSPMLRTALQAAGFAISASHRVSDDLSAIESILGACLAEADAVVFSGGASVGKYDFVPTAVRNLGADVLVHGVAMKPGKPFLFAVTPSGGCIFGLPGNPLSAATGLHEFVLPALRAMAGYSPQDCRPLVHARLSSPIRSKPGRRQFVLAALLWTTNGPEVAPVETHSSADVAAGAKADGVVVVPEDARGLEAGTMVAFRPWRALP